MSQKTERISKPRASGNLRIGDHWNAITIIALSQSNPLKAVAELVGPCSAPPRLMSAGAAAKVEAAHRPAFQSKANDHTTTKANTE